MRAASVTSHTIVVAVGTDFHPFNRLIRWFDSWLAEQASGSVSCLVQYGTSAPPKHAESAAHLSHPQLQEAMAEATIIVCHGGPATIAEARRYGHRPICVPRDHEYGEHVDGHQKQFVRRLAAAQLVTATETESASRSALDAALEAAPLDALRQEASVESSPSEAVRRVGELVGILLNNRDRPDMAPMSARDDYVPAPAVDVVVATRNRPELLSRAVHSILTQQYDGDIWVIVVFDQHQPDLSLNVDDPHRGVRVTANERRQGLAGARNTGILAGDAELVAFCDDDDLWLPGKLQRQVAALRDDPATTLVCCGIQVRYADSVVERTLPLTEVSLRDLLRSRLMELHPSTFLLRRTALVDGLGLVAEDAPGSYAEDYELLIRAAKYGRVRNLQVVGAEILWHHQSYFTARWETIISALTWLLGRYPEFHAVPAGLARIRGQIAFALAATAQRKAAVRWAVAAFRASPRELRAYLA
ncbi:MAG: glycosyltransferase, partial [Geodermatophilaceae bacterium]